jgi:hypothetical protein
MKRTALRALLVVLIIVEIYLCSALLPTSWQTASVHGLSHILPKTYDYSVVTHPALDYEIDDMLKKNPGLRVALYTVITLLLVGNTFLVTKVWRALRLAPQA